LTTTGTLNPFSNTVGTPSAVQTYTLAGAILQGNITVTPPAGYEVSSNGTTWFTNTTPLVVTPTAGTVNATISVRLNAATAGSYSGNITHTSTNAVTRNVAVTGTAVNPPVLTVAATLATFVQYLPAASPTQSYTITGNFLTANLVITIPANYQLSFNGGLNWSTGVVTITPTAGAINLPVLVRLNATGIGVYNATITQAVAGMATINTAVNGYATNPAGFVLYPNPVYRTLFFVHPLAATRGTANIYNLAGVKLNTYTVEVGSLVHEIPVLSLPQGMYILEYKNGETRKVFTFIRH
jgi:hypothetical protein